MRWLNLGWIMVLLGVVGGTASTQLKPSQPSAEVAPSRADPNMENPNSLSSGTPGAESTTSQAALPPLEKDVAIGWLEIEKVYAEAFGSSSGSDGSLSALKAFFENPKRNRHSVLIAFAPDPIESHLEAQFDQVISGIRRAFASSRPSYNLDHFWFPWPSREGESSLHLRLPGLLLFRGSVEGSKETRFFSVLVVGETTTQGVLPEAFQNALAIARAIRKDGQPISILGPTFSGSSYSLNRELAQEPEDEIVLMTGTATADDLPGSNSPAKLVFRRAVLGDQELQRLAYRFLETELGWDFNHLALVKEGDSVYGQRFNNKKNPLEPSFEISFPSGLAELRAEWTEEAQPPPGLRGLAISLLHSFRPLDLHVTSDRRPSDVVPQLGTTTSITNDLALGDLLRVGCGSSIRYVGLVATDSRDRLALARRIRDRCPRVVLFTFGSDLLSLHPNAARDLEGTLVITPSPKETQGRTFWQPKENGLAQFASDTEEGVFAAASWFLKPGILPPFHPRIAAVSNGALIPVALLGGEGAVADTETPPGVLSSIWTDIFPLLVCLGVGYLVFWKAKGDALPSALSDFEFADFVPFAIAEVALVSSLGLLVCVAFPLNFDLLSLASSASILFCTLRFRHWRPLKRIGASRLVLFLAACLGVTTLMVSGGRNLFLARLDASLFSTPIPSLLLLAAATLAWSLEELDRRRLIAEHGVEWKFESPNSLLDRCVSIGRSANRAIQRVIPPSRIVVAVTPMALTMCVILFREIQPIMESAKWGRVYVVLVLGVALLSMSSFARFSLIWLTLKELLECLRLMGLEKDFDRLKGVIDWKPMRAFAAPPIKLRFTWLSLKAAMKIEQVGALRDSFPLGAGELAELESELTDAQRFGDRAREREVRRRLQDAFDRIVKQYSGSASGNRREVVDLTCFRIAAFFRHAVAHMRSCLLGTLLSGFLLLAAIATYSFQPKGVLFLAVWLGLLLVTLRTLWIMIEMDRDSVLSAIGGTKPGEVEFTKAFLGNTLTYGVLPLAGLAVLQFPQLGIYMGRFLAPFYQIMPFKH